MNFQRIQDLGFHLFMLVFFVSPEIDFPLKCFGAQITLKRFVTGVFPRMSDQIRTLTERFTTNDTLVRLLTSMSVRVFLHV